MISLVLATYLADREIKNHINATRKLGSKEVILEGKATLRNVHNHVHPMERFGQTKEQKDLLVKGSILCPILYYVYAHLKGKKGGLFRLSSSLLLGGALGNWVERLEAGYATDYISLEVGPKKLRRYCFNLADVAIVLGGTLGFLAILLHKDRK